MNLLETAGSLQCFVLFVGLGIIFFFFFLIINIKEAAGCIHSSPKEYKEIMITIRKTIYMNFEFILLHPRV